MLSDAHGVVVALPLTTAAAHSDPAAVQPRVQSQGGVQAGQQVIVIPTAPVLNAAVRDRLAIAGTPSRVDQHHLAKHTAAVITTTYEQLCAFGSAITLMQLADA